MSWETINRILGLATIDQKFAQELLKNPVAAIQQRGFSLTAEERRVLDEISVSNLNELSQQLMRKLHHTDLDER